MANADGPGTTYEKLRIAHELRRRPLVRDALAAGHLSYSAVRVLTLLVGPIPDVDATLIDLAQAGTIMDLEQSARVYQRYWDQDRPPPPIADRRGLHITPPGDGSAVVEINLEASEAQGLVAALQAVTDHEAVDKSPDGDSSGGDLGDPPVGDDADGTVDESEAGDNVGGPVASLQLVIARPVWPIGGPGRKCGSMPSWTWFASAATTPLPDLSAVMAGI